MDQLTCLQFNVLKFFMTSMTELWDWMSSLIKLDNSFFPEFHEISQYLWSLSAVGDHQSVIIKAWSSSRLCHHPLHLVTKLSNPQSPRIHSSFEYGGTGTDTILVLFLYWFWYLQVSTIFCSGTDTFHFSHGSIILWELDHPFCVKIKNFSLW